MKNIKKIIAGSLTLVSLLALSPMTANAAWKKDSKGWWYTEGNSYARDKWDYIDGKWYYFDYNGYLYQNEWTFDGYYVNYNGEWTKSSKYRRYDILGIAIASHSEKGMNYYEAGDKGPLTVMHGEPCVYTWDDNDYSKYLGMDTLNVYDRFGNVVDKLRF